MENTPRFVSEFYVYNKNSVKSRYLPSRELDEAIANGYKVVTYCKRGLISPNEAVWKLGQIFAIWE